MTNQREVLPVAEYFMLLKCIMYLTSCSLRSLTDGWICIRGIHWYYISLKMVQWLGISLKFPVSQIEKKKPLLFEMFVFESQDVVHKLASHFSHRTNQSLVLEKHYHMCSYCGFTGRKMGFLARGVFSFTSLPRTNSWDRYWHFAEWLRSQCNLLDCLTTDLFLIWWRYLERTVW